MVSFSMEQFSEYIDLYSTKCFIFSLKCTKIIGGWGSALDPPSCDGLGYENCEFTELLRLPGYVPDLIGNNIISFAIIRNFIFLNNRTVFRK